ncbi:MAG: hypothetical protein V4645_13620 [Pseudomonadota bacterium]
MTSPALLARAWRLPRDLALITLAVEVVLMLFNAGMLLPGVLDSQQLLEIDTSASAMLPMASGFFAAWMLGAALAWSHARQALEVRGVVNVAGLTDARTRYPAPYFMVLLLNYYGLGPLSYQLQQKLLSDDWLQGVFGRFAATSSVVVYEAVQLALLALSVWFAAWVALRAPKAVGAGDREAAAEAQVSGVPRRAVAMLVAVVFTSLQMWCAMLASIGSVVIGPMNGVALLLFWGALPLVSFALSFWGGWLGTAPGLAQVRPFKAVAASALALALVLASCMAVFFVGVELLLPPMHGLAGLGALIVLVAALVPLYFALTVLLTRTVTRRLYRPYL